MARKAAKRSEGPVRMSSRLASACKRCGGWMPVGTAIEWKKGEGAWHEVCPAVPAARPARRLVNVAAEVERLEAELEGLKEVLELACASHRAVEVPYSEMLGAAGYCSSCKGSGYVWHWDCDYPCSHPEPASMEAALGRHPELRACGEVVAEARRVWESASAEVKSAERWLEEVCEVRRGDVVEVVKGRKVKVGTKGAVIWMGGGNWGERVGVKDAAGEVHWTALSNVRVVEREVMEEAAALAA